MRALGLGENEVGVRVLPACWDQSGEQEAGRKSSYYQVKERVGERERS
jgi:hypothetical protein